MNSEKKKQADDNLFREAMKDVTPLSPSNRITVAKEKPSARPLEHAQPGDDESSGHEEILISPGSGQSETAEDFQFLRPGYQKRILRRLRRGHFSPADQIDLHHMNQATARKVLLAFLTQSIQRGFNCVRVIHGKGLRSVNEPRLRSMTQQILSQHPKVVAFNACRPEHGGSGAVNVLLVSKMEGGA